MAIKLSKKDITKNEDNQGRITLRRSDLSYDSVALHNWEQSNKEALDILNKYNERVNNNGWLSSDDLSSYRKALDSYISTSDRLRGFNKTFGQGYSDDEEKAWAETLASMDKGYKGISDYYGQWKTEDSFNASKLHYEMSSFDLQAGQLEIDDLQSQLQNKYARASELDKEFERIAQYVKQNPGAYSDSAAKVEALKREKESLGIEDLEALLDEKQRHYNQAEAIQKPGKMQTEAMSAPDLEEYVQKSYGLKGLFGTPLNDVHHTRTSDNRYLAQGGLSSSKDDALRKNRAMNMTDDEAKTYSYYLGKYGKEKAEEYFNSLIPTIDARIGGEVFSSLEDRPVLEYVFGVAAGLDQFATGLDSLFANENNVVSSPIANTSQLVREDLADRGGNLPDWLGGGSVGQAGYDLITNTANMVPSILASTVANAIVPGSGAIVGNTLLGASAAGHAYNEMLNLGYDKEQARMYAGMVGGSEAGLQYLLGGIGGLSGNFAGKALGKVAPNAVKALQSVDNVFAKAAIKLGTFAGNMGSEALEEGLQTVLEPWFKSIATGVDFEAPDVEEVLYSSLLGALTSAGFGAAGGVSNAVGTIKGKISENAQAKNVYGNDVQALVAEALSIDPDNAYAQRLQAMLDGGKSLSGGQINRLVNANNTALRSQDITKIESAVEARLTELGEDGDVKQLSKVLAKQVAGETLTSSEKAILEQSKYGNRVANELNPENIESGGYSSAWAESIDTDKINADAYSKKVQAHDTEQAPSTVAIKSIPATKNTSPVENATEGEFEASDSRITINKDGEDVEVKIDKIESIDNGEMSIKLDDGEVVDAGDVNFGNSGIGLVYQAAKEMSQNVGGFNVDTANMFVRGFTAESGQSAAEYIHGWISTYKFGARNTPFSALSTNPVASKLSEEQRKNAYNLGTLFGKEKVAINSQKAIGTEVKTDSKKKKGRVIFDGKTYGKKLNERQRASMKALRFLAEALGRDIYVEDITGENGYYDPRDRSIHISLKAGALNEALMLFTTAHELTHDVREALPDKFKVLADAVFEEYTKKFGDQVMEDLIDAKIAFLKEKGRITETMTEEEAYDLAYEEVICDCLETLLVDTNALESLSQHIYGKDKGLWERIKAFLAKLVARIKAAYAGAIPDSEEGQRFRDLGEGAERIKNLWVDAIVEASDVVEIDKNTESVAPIMYSYKTWTASEYVIHRDQMAEKIAKALDVSVKKAKSYIDDINSIAKLIANDRARLDYEASSFGSAFVSNVEYGGSFDYTTLCKKRRIYTGTFTEIQKRLKDVALTPDDILTIRNLMLEEGIEATCGLCYVEGSRANMGKFAKEFIRLYKRDNPLSWIPNMADVNTPDGVEQMRISHPEAYEQYVYFWNHYGKLKDSDPALFASQQKPKLYEARKEYKGEILEHFEDVSTVAKKNRNGGIRMQSFSDFEIVHLIDTMQVIMDMSTVGLAGQAYTKVPEFAKAFGNTGLKINLSLIAKGVDADGKLIFDDREGMPHNTAFDLRDKYSKNVGTIIVTFTDEQLLAAMADPRIDFIIPFHRSQWKKGQYGAMGLPKGTKDYTYMQNEKFIKKTYHEYRGRMVLDKASNYMPNEYWDFSKSGKENAEAYLKMCAENNKRPKFYKLLDYDGKGTYSLKKDGSTDGYWKLLIDFKMYDNNGVGSPQEAVTPTFNMDEAQTMLDEYQGGHSKYPVASSVVDTFVEKYNQEHGTKYSDKASKKSGYATKITEDSESSPYDGKILYADSEVYDYSFMVNLDPMTVKTVPPLSTVKVDGRISQDRTTELGLQNAASIGVQVSENQYAVKNVYTKRDIILGKKGLQHGLDAKDIPRLRTNARLSSIGGYIVQNAVPINGLEKENKQANGTYAMACLLNDGNGFVVAIVTVDEFSSKATKFDFVEITHSINGRFLAKKEDSRSSTRELELGQESLSTTAISKISIADFLEIVNSSHQSILSNDVLEHFGKTRNPGGHYAKRVLFSDKLSQKASYSERESAKKPRSAQEQRDQGYMLSEAMFGRLYYAHKLDIGNRWGDIEEQVESIKTLGFKGGSGAYNVIPVGAFKVNTFLGVSQYEMFKRWEDEGKVEKGYAEAYKTELGEEYGKPILENVTQRAYGPRKGDYVLLVPKHMVDEGRYHAKVKQGFKPLPYEIVQVEEDHQSYYELYEKAYKEYEKANSDIRYSDSPTQPLSKRAILANALETVAQADEKTLLQTYVENIDKLNSEQEKLSKVMEQIDEIRYKKSLSILGEEMSVKTFEKRAKAKAKKNGISEEDVQFKLDRSNSKYIAYAKGYGKILEADKTFRSAEENAKLKELYAEAKDISDQITTFDKELLRLEAMKPIKDVLQREKAMAYKRALEKGKELRKEAVAKAKEQAAKTQRELMDRYQESRKRATEGRYKTAMRHKIKDVVNELNQYLLNGTKNKHVPIELQKAVAEALDAVNMDTVGAEERIAKLQAEMMRAKTPEEAQAIAKKIEHIQEMGGNMEKKISRLKTAYDSIINSDDPLIANSHDEVISNTIDRVMQLVGDTPLRDMSLHQLEEVYEMYKMVLHSIRSANKAFKAKKSEEISVIANRVLEEIEKLGKKRIYRSKTSDAVSAFDWNNLKPVYAFERIGSASFTDVFDSVRAGEDTWAVDMDHAQGFREEQYKKYKYDSWDFNKKHKFTSTTGKSFELTLGQIMSLYAFAKRGDQAKDHLRYGGFVFDGLTEVKVKNKVGVSVTYQLKDATAYNLSEEILASIIGALTPEQTAFVDAMQDYLSTVMGEKGNEVSLELYGIKLFKEKHYFPLKSAPQFLERAREQAQGDVKIKNKGFTKETTPKAKNPIVLTSFMDVWAGHVNEMSMYHAFTLALEDFYRVFNYKTPASETMDSESVISFLENAHGAASVSYIDQLLKDLNGGARSDPRETIGKALMSRFKKTAVMGSLSVVVQQPTSIVRAMALVDAKHFGIAPIARGTIRTFNRKKHKELWAEVKKYAPVAIIKEMGNFDTGMGQSSVEWLKGEKTFMDKVDDALSKAPAVADEMAWITIWEAIKRETLQKNPKLKASSEEFLKLCGERFTEVVTKTQVYDSTLAKSSNMRSKGTLMNMWTAFMAEPTTSINMVVDAFRKGDKKYTAKVLGSVLGSVALNAALVSLIYAMRDDDEDETYAEKYVSRFTTEFLDGINPITYIPFAKDIWSVAQGFDIERSDMSLITSLVDSLQKTTKVLGKDTSNMDEDAFAEHQKQVSEALWSIVDSIASIAGIPEKNIRRDINGIINLFKTLGKDMDTSFGSLMDNIAEELQSSTPVWNWFPSESKGDKLYDAIVRGDTAYVERLKSGYKTESDYNSAVRKALRENDSRIKEAAEAFIDGDYAKYNSLREEIVGEGIFSREIVTDALKAEYNYLKEKAKESNN